MADILAVLRERGFVKQTTHEEPLERLLREAVVTGYVGFDPTGDSLHVGHLLPIMAMAHFQRAGHRPIAVMGGGTAMVGDPSGKTEMRMMLSREDIIANAAKMKEQISRLIDFSGGKALLVDNSEWLLSLNYIDFLREIGSQFSVNRMLTAECFRSRMERGLSFLEFNYMLLQSYDFLCLYRRYGCRLQMGGDDQWSNIIGGIELIRRLEQGEAYGLTFPLILTVSGKKMGKVEAGAVWLDPDKTSPYDFYQYWRNTHDNDVALFLALYTFLPMDEVRRLGSLKGRELNEAKKVLAFEVTSLIHGREEAEKAQKAAEALFGEGGGDEELIPSTEIPKEKIESGMMYVDLMALTGLASSKGDARRLIKQGGAYINDERVSDTERFIDAKDIVDGKIILRKGKKDYHLVKPV